jgi:hypothetical protein
MLQVRKRAQNCLHTCFTYFHYTYQQFITPIVAYLKDPNVEEHAFKVSVNVIF